MAKAPKWYRTDAEKSRMARRHAHEPFVEKERIVLDPYKLPAGIVAIAILWIIAGIVGLVLLAIALIDIARLTSQGGVEVHTEYLFLGVIIDLVFSIAYIHAGRSLLLRRRFGYSFTMFAVWILLAISVILVGIVTAGSAITGLWVLLCAGICLLPVILIAVYVIIYMRQYDSMFK